MIYPYVKSLFLIIFWIFSCYSSARLINIFWSWYDMAYGHGGRAGLVSVPQLNISFCGAFYEP